MPRWVYILQSQSTGRFYCGQTNQRAGRIVYSKGNDHVVDAVRCAMLAREQSVLNQVGEETVSLVPLTTEPVFI